MKQPNYTHTNPILQADSPRYDLAIFLRGVDPLLALILVTELLTPFLIWKGVLPSFTRWVSDAAVVTIVGLAYARMMVFDQFPSPIWLVVGFSLIGVVTALANGQGILATVWGWWQMFRYPLVGIYAYLQSSWPEPFPQRLRVLSVALLSLEVIVQLGQYLTGEPPGDNLAGLFGWHGTGPLVIFTLFVLCLALGHWLVNGRWRLVSAVLVLGTISSVLGEIKFYPLAVLGLAAFAGLFFVVKGGRPWKLVPYVVLLGVVVWAFVSGYNTFVPGAASSPLEGYLDSETLSNYLYQVNPSSAHPGTLNIGRNYAFKLSWDTLADDPVTLLFGLGLGARGESRSLGTAGIGFEGIGSKLPRRSSLLVMMQETGSLGLIAIVTFIVWVAGTLLRDIRREPQSKATELRYALLLFSTLWPLWLWYQTVWDHGVTMLLYWGALGYAMGESKRSHGCTHQFALSDASSQLRQGIE